MFLFFLPDTRLCCNPEKCPSVNFDLNRAEAVLLSVLNFYKSHRMVGAFGSFCLVQQHDDPWAEMSSRLLLFSVLELLTEMPESCCCSSWSEIRECSCWVKAQDWVFYSFHRGSDSIAAPAKQQRQLHVRLCFIFYTNSNIWGEKRKKNIQPR